MGLDLNNRRNSTYVIVAVGLVFLSILLLSQLAGGPTRYEQELQQQREQKNLFFKNSLDSPIPREQKSSFDGLAFFPIQEEYRVAATLIPAETPDTVQLLRTRGLGGPQDRMVKVGKLRFTLQGQVHQLTAFAYLDPSIGSYFVPFRDLTSGESTYGGGRYLEVPIADPLMVDFNQAYNPDCVYNEESSCPLPPRENRLEVEVRAGELDFTFAPQASEAADSDS